MAIISKTNRDGVDVVIENLQQKFYGLLLGCWLGGATYQMYPRANKNAKNNQLIPEISLDEKDYSEVLSSDKYSVTSFFLNNDERVFQDEFKRIKQRISIIFQCDLVALYGIDERADELFNSDVLRVLTKENLYIHGDIEMIEGVENVYSEFNLTGELLDNINMTDISQYHVLRVDFDVIYKQNCNVAMTPSCAPVLIYEDGVLVDTVASGGTYSYTSGAGVASQTFNGGAVTDQDSGTTKVITVKDTAGTNVGTKGTDTALALDITIADAEIQINTVPVDQVEAEGVKNIDVVDSTSAPTGNWNGTAWEIDNSTINVNGDQIASTPPASVVNLNVHDSVGNDVGAINGLTVEIDDVTVDNSDVSYTVDIPAEGVFVLPDVTVTINGASQGSFPSVKDLSFDASNIIYIRPANSGYGTTSYLTGDEGYNETNYPAPSAPAFGVPAYLDPTNPKMLLNNNVFGHKQRFTGINGGYYDYSDGQYKLANGTVSDQATTFGTIAANTSYLIDHHTGLGWKWNIQGVGTWSAKVSDGLGLTHASYSDWFLPSRYQYRSLYCVFNLGTNLTSLVPFNSINSCKTSTPTFGSETTTHHQINGAASTLSRADSISDAAYFCRWHF